MATKQIAWNTGNGNITLTYQGQGDGTIIVSSDPNNLGSVRSQIITIKTTAGSPAVVKNLTISQGACPIPIGTVLNYSYTGSYQEVTLPAGQYKLQCWGAQGGSNAAASSYSITAKAGGKGGYSEGVITLSSPTTVRIYVGGQGSSSAGGFNGGGSTSGSASYNSGDEQGVSRMGGGGGATDIRLSDGALLSRMIVAGGGSGGAMCYKKKTTTTTTWTSWGDISGGPWIIDSASNTTMYINATKNSGLTKGKTYRITGVTSTNTSVVNPSTLNSIRLVARTPSGGWVSQMDVSLNQSFTLSTSSSIGFYGITAVFPGNVFSSAITVTIHVEEEITSSSTDTYNDSQVGYVGGGTNGGGYSSSYYGKQNGAGNNGSFGLGANQTATNYRYASGAGGGGWYGGGRNYSDSDMNACKMSGGGSGFVNTAASAGNRPSGYTGLQLDSGTTYAGNQSFPNTAGSGNETGHSGNGYAKITRLE